MGEDRLERPRPNDAAGSNSERSSAVDPGGSSARSDREPASTDEPDDVPESWGEHDRSAEEAAPNQPPAAASRRALKLVLHLQPTDATGYRALLALGADGCDPVLRFTEVANLAAALDEAPGLVAEAEARWQAQPRYPAPTKAGPATAPSRAKVAQSRPVASEGDEPAGDASRPKPTAEPSPKSAPAGQLSLFS